jgi:hypothetical protein
MTAFDECFQPILHGRFSEAKPLPEVRAVERDGLLQEPEQNPTFQGV